jgi:hypothetical protein
MVFPARLKHSQKLLLNGMSVVAVKHGFERKVYGQSFRMPRPFGWAAVHLSFIPHGESDFDLTADVALRVDAVEELLHADNSLISKKEKLEAATIGCELGNLSDGKQRRWKIVTESDVKPVIASLDAALMSIALPYMDRYSNLEETFAVLCRNDAEAWLHSPLHHYRGMRALALAIFLEKYDRLEGIIEQSEAFMKSIGDPNLRFFELFARTIRERFIELCQFKKRM